MSYRVVLYRPDRAVRYDGRTPDAVGVGGGITARLSLLHALAALGHDVTVYVNCGEPVEHAGVRYVPLDHLHRIETDVLIAISTGGDLSLAPLGAFSVYASLRMLWVQGVPKPAGLEIVAPDYVCAASNFLRDVCVTRWGIEPERMFVCYNGLQQSRFAAAEERFVERDPFSLAYIGPAEKGLAAATAVLEKLRVHDARYTLDVFGGNRLWGAADDAVPMSEGVTYRGMLGQDELIPLLFNYEVPPRSAGDRGRFWNRRPGSQARGANRLRQQGRGVPGTVPIRLRRVRRRGSA